MTQLTLEMARVREEYSEDLDVSSASLIEYTTDVNNPEVLLWMKPLETSSSSSDATNKLLEPLIYSTQQQQQHVLGDYSNAHSSSYHVRRWSDAVPYVYDNVRQCLLKHGW